MGFPAKKRPDDQDSEVMDLSNDREQGLSRNFEDPSLGDLIPGAGSGSGSSGGEPLSVMDEAVEAVQELVLEAAGADSVHNFEEPMPTFLLEGQPEAAQEPALWEMSQKLFSLVCCERTFDDLTEASLAAVMVALQAQAGSILELDTQRQDFFFRASVGGSSPAEKLKAFRVPLTKGIVGHVAESRQSLLVRDLEEDELQMRAISVGVGFEAKTCMAAPIVVGSQLYGVIEVFNKKGGGYFEEKELRVLEEGVRMITKILEVRFLMAELVRRIG